MPSNSEVLTVRITSNTDGKENGVEVSFSEDSELFQTVKRFYIKLLDIVKHDNK